MQSHHSVLPFFCASLSLPSVYKQLDYSDAEGTIRRGVCASAEQAMVRCSVAPGDGQVSATDEDL